jgi:hypothetical protein
MGCFDYALARSTKPLRFLRLAKKPNAPRPDAKSGKAAGSGVAAMSDVVAI